MTHRTAPDSRVHPLLLMPADARRTIVVAVIAAVLVALLAVLGAVGATSGFDQSLVVALNGAHTGVLGAFTNFVYAALSPLFAIVITVIVTAVIWAVTRRLEVAATFAFVIAVTWLPTAVIKVLAHRARPDAALLPNPFNPAQTDSSFPSGHVAFVTAFVVTLCFLLYSTRARNIVIVVGAIVVIVVAVAVVIDGLHFPTDVLASIIWSAGIAPLVLLVSNRFIVGRIASRMRATA